MTDAMLGPDDWIDEDIADAACEIIAQFDSAPAAISESVEAQASRGGRDMEAHITGVAERLM